MAKETRKWIIEQLIAAGVMLSGMAIGWAVCVAGLWILGVL